MVITDTGQNLGDNMLTGVRRPLSHIVKFDRRYKPSKPMYFETREVIAAAFAAYRRNNGYLKSDSFDYHKNIWVSYANKNLVKDHFGRKSEATTHKLTDLELTQEDYDNADMALDHFKKYTFKSLGAVNSSNGLSQFQQDVLAAISNEEGVEKHLIGLVAYIPELVKREKNEAAAKKTIKSDYSDSTHQGEKGDKIEGDFTVLERRFIHSVGRYVYSLGMNGNLYGAWSTNLQMDVGSTYTLSAKIRSHGQSFKYKFPETQLNYVKSKG